MIVSRTAVRTGPNDLGRHGPGDSPLPYNTSETPPTLEVGRPSSTGAEPYMVREEPKRGAAH